MPMLSTDVQTLCDANYVNNAAIKTPDNGLLFLIYPAGVSQSTVYDGTNISYAVSGSGVEVAITSIARPIVLKVFIAEPSGVTLGGAPLPKLSPAGFATALSGWRFNQGFVFVKYQHIGGGRFVSERSSPRLQRGVPCFQGIVGACLLFLESPLHAVFLGADSQPRAQSAKPKGEWGPILPCPNVPIHTHVLPTGKVLFWGRREWKDGKPRDNSARGLNEHDTSPFLWDPQAKEGEQFTPLPHPGFNMFCSSHTFLPDGRLLVIGGHLFDQKGVRKASIFDPGPGKNTWTRDRRHERRPLVSHGRYLVRRSRACIVRNE